MAERPNEFSGIGLDPIFQGQALMTLQRSQHYLKISDVALSFLSQSGATAGGAQGLLLD